MKQERLACKRQEFLLNTKSGAGSNPATSKEVNRASDGPASFFGAGLSCQAGPHIPPATFTAFPAPNLIICFAIMLTILIIPAACGSVYAAQQKPAIWKILMAEAVSEGERGMYAVACVIRNRGGDLRGFCGAKRNDLNDFCKRQGQHYISLAQAIEKRVFEEQAPDITNGATHFENTRRFGMPSWAKEMTMTAKIGSHTFYKKRR